MYITLEEIKKHLNIDSNFTDDDNYLLSLEKVAEDSVSKHIDNDLINLENENGEIPNALKHALLLMIGTFYSKRESVSFASVTEVPLAYEYLLSLYKNYNGEGK